MSDVITIILIGVIAIYAGYVIGRKVKQAKNGQFCSGNCSSCGSSCPSAQKEQKK